MEQPPPSEVQHELESFRKQWQEEVSARAKNPATSSAASSSRHPEPHSHQRRPSRPTGPNWIPSSSSRPTRRPDAPIPASKAGKQHQQLGQLAADDDEDYTPAPIYDFPAAGTSKPKVGGEDDKPKEPKTALEFYEHAVERETTGKLGDSLSLYRKAFRMDDAVDMKYRHKHFGDRWGKKPAPEQQVNPSNASSTMPNTAHHSLQGSDGKSQESKPLTFPELIASFAGLKLEPAEPEIEGMEAPPCPISNLPSEILVHILRDVAVADVGDFARLARVCKQFAYLVATEDQIWRRVCIGPEFGFGGMHHYWQRSITWKPLGLDEMLADSEEDDEDDEIITAEFLQARREEEAHKTTLSLYRRGVTNNNSYGSWKTMFRRRPRIRFNGCYISTVNYIRAGQNSGNHLTWNSPVHIVTYYRYLRLFRDGTAIHLTTTDEPAHVVHHLTKENLITHHADTTHHLHLPSSVMAAAHKGRWRLSSSRDVDRYEVVTANTGFGAPSNPPQSDPTAQSKNNDSKPPAEPTPLEAEGDLFVETEGVAPRYMFRIDLSLQSAGKTAGRNNKLAWKGFWSHNRLTDDWAQFTLKNDKPFFFSRVKSYGIGE
ncbi:hypothetical protein F5Y18DRAFT_305568 [Xylariaceae sp. FL1019]|nr:hypothetical protein F5Y18DRAFT_305568 [Xylariaceae sp. FL1019]